VGETSASWTPSFRGSFIESAAVSGKSGEFQFMTDGMAADHNRFKPPLSM
jgi:hypothetical protein